MMDQIRWQEIYRKTIHSVTPCQNRWCCLRQELLGPHLTHSVAQCIYFERLNFAMLLMCQHYCLCASIETLHKSAKEERHYRDASAPVTSSCTASSSSYVLQP